jgi:PilZ domain
MSAMTEERRAHERVRANLPARWEGVLTSRDGMVSDLSESGCFVVTKADVQPKELIGLEIELETGRRLFLWGEVVYHVEEIGFALRFTGAEETELRMLGALIDFIRSSQESE